MGIYCLVMIFALIVIMYSYSIQELRISIIENLKYSKEEVREFLNHHQKKRGMTICETVFVEYCWTLEYDPASIKLAGFRLALPR